jgi:hypothetical protein
MLGNKGLFTTSEYLRDTIFGTGGQEAAGSNPVAPTIII